uniref:DUF3014 domain-containing protein n=1 Tax=Ningiella ruwaisensis TaxID=2364274 RepID=UPI00109F1795|nr:DUF3014 domain-containing protein [Ningiella ruwaisensis]
MSETPSQFQQMRPYLIVAGVLVILVLVVMLWPSSEDPLETRPVPVPTQEVELPTMDEQALEEQNNETEVFEAPQIPSEVVIGEEEQNVEMLEPIIEDAEDVVLDMSDVAVKAAVMEAIKSPELTKLLVDEALLQKFVINVNNLANEEITIKDNLFTPPDRGFSVYTQADKMWIDRTSFQRYSPYIDAIEESDTEALLNVYDSYKPTLEEKFAEIARPGESLDETVIKAINELLDTPQVPVPIEVYSDSVMYKFADPKLESLSEPQKQMIRMGPDNMRRLKDILRDVKAELEARQ